MSDTLYGGINPGKPVSFSSMPQSAARGSSRGRGRGTSSNKDDASFEGLHGQSKALYKQQLAN